VTSTFRQRCDRLLEQIRAEVTDTHGYTGRAKLHDRVIDAVRSVPRHEFVSEDLQPSAYNNHPLPIGHGQTISQPYIVALMTDLLDPQPEHTVLEIGTGSGYQAAVLACLVKQVYSIEIVAALGEEAGERLQRLGYNNVQVRVGNGYFGWPEHAPYDSIIVTAAASHVPDPLIEQLKPGGVLVIPVGGQFYGQELLVIEKDAKGKVHEKSVLPVVFVPLTGSTEEHH
jgi:protein-L-isoaspartate(D-aspartate) O-methyltransferase